MLDNIFKVYKTVNLRNRQRKLNKDFEKNGLTNEILNEQIRINKERNKHNIVDDTKETLYEEYVQ